MVKGIKKFRVFVYLFINLIALFLLTNCTKGKKKELQEPVQANAEPESAPMESDSLDTPVVDPSSEETIVMDPTIEEAPTSEESVSAPIAYTAEHIRFSFDKSNVSDEYITIIKGIVDFLQKNSQSNIICKGHTDQHGSEAYNLALGQRRAEAVKKELISNGIQEERIETVSLGENEPLTIAYNASAYAQNRRVECSTAMSAANTIEESTLNSDQVEETPLVEQQSEEVIQSPYEEEQVIESQPEDDIISPPSSDSASEIENTESTDDSSLEDTSPTQAEEVIE